MIETPSVSREEYGRNTKRSSFCGEHCFVCGSSCRNPTLWIHVIHGGGYVLLAEEATPGWIPLNGDLGLQPVGASCLKRFPELKPYIQRIPRPPYCQEFVHFVTAKRKK